MLMLMFALMLMLMFMLMLVLMPDDKAARCSSKKGEAWT